MKLLFVGDMHLRSAQPARRKDDFSEAQYKKVEHIFRVAKHYEAPIIQTGDVFDTETSDLKTMVRYLPMFLNYEHGVYCAIGNHDVYGASITTVPRTALGLFASVGAVRLLGHEPVLIGNDQVAVCGTSYMHEGHPSPVDGKHNILVSHEMVLVDKIWKEQEHFTYAYDYAIQNSGWDVILCGHYHYSFKQTQGNLLILNPGAVVRIKASKGDMALVPSVVLYDTVTRKNDWLPLSPVEPSEKVFVPAEAPVVPAVNPDLEDFVASLSPSVKENMNYGPLSDVVIRVIEDVDCRQEVSDLIKRYLAQVEAS